MSAPVRYRKPKQLAGLGTRHAVVEASAGTGKTYLLEHLVVELLLVHGIELEQILVVTFTEKATAELVHRVRTKLQALRDLRPTDPAAVDAATAPDDECWQIDDRARERLQRALFSFDRASISTIHGFCQRILSDNAFLNRRLFDEEPIDEEVAFHGAFVEVLRTEVARDPALAACVAEWVAGGQGIAQLESMLARAWRNLACLHPPRPEALRPPPLDGAALAAALALWPKGPPAVDALAAAMRARKVHASTARSAAKKLGELDELLGRCQDASPARLLAAIEEWDALPYLVDNILHLGVDPLLAPYVRAVAALDALICPLAGALAQQLLPVIGQRVARRKRERGVYDFQDMLSLLAQSLEGDGPRQRTLLAKLRGAYRVALIDEFQDTDETQWTIFRRIFFESDGTHVITVIGDPKQAIYGFRGADVHTYLRARREIEAAGGTTVFLTENFRSTKPLVDAYNAILDQAAEPPFFPARGGIAYDHPVTCGRPTLALTDATGAPASPVVLLDVQPEAGVQALLTWQVKRALHAAMVDELRGILAGGLSLDGRPLGARDVYVLTRTVRESREVGEVLRAARIPFAFFKQEKLFQTVEADEVLDLLRAVAEPDDRTARSRAFITPFFGLGLTDLAACDGLSDGDPLLARLHDWRALGEEGAFEALFARIVEESGVVRREVFFRDGERTLTNYLHLFELLQEEAARTRSSLRDLVQTLAAWIAGTRKPPGEGSDIQRLETDAAAVQIMTIHHAKGLEAPVVFLYGGLFPYRESRVFAFHDAEGRRVVRVGKPPAHETTAWEDEQDDEERRVLYVALTRARGRLYLPRLPREFKAYRSRRGSYRFINDRLDALLGGFTPLDTRAMFDQRVLPCPGEGPPVASAAPPAAVAAWRPPAALLSDDTAADDALRDIARARAGFLVTSYSAVKAAHGGFVPAAVDTHDPADEERSEPAPEPVLPADELPRGRLSGTFLHEVLELVPLESLAPAPPVDDWRARPEIAALFERARRRHDRNAAHLPHAARLVHAALAAPMRLGDTVVQSLAAAQPSARELEFLYPIPERSHPLLSFSLSRLQAGEGRGEGPPFSISRGVVRGFIDLLFQHDGRTYVLDWKGDWLPTWDPPTLRAHCEQNYDIQARLYTLAALRFLRVADPRAYDDRFGGVVYCFLRARRADDERAGVYFRKPTWDDVLGWEKAMLGQSFWGLS